MTTKIINRIEKKIDQIEKLHDKESMMCEEVKDLLAELKENQEDESQEWEKDLEDDDFEEDEEDIDEEDEK